MNILAIIPARGGSKGLQGKNIKIINGHPLIAYSIQAALATKAITRTIVSTDSEEIAEIAIKYGAEVPFIRPSELANDMSRDFEVFLHAINWLKKNENYSPELIIHLRPTSPIRFVVDIEECISLMINNPKADSLRIVTPAQTTPYKMWVIDKEDAFLKPLLKLNGIKEPFNEPRQNLPTVYWQVGTLDVIRTRVILEKSSMSGKHIVPFIIDTKFAADIDDLNSFEAATEIIQKYDCIKF